MSVRTLIPCCLSFLLIVACGDDPSGDPTSTSSNGGSGATGGGGSGGSGAGASGGTGGEGGITNLCTTTGDTYSFESNFVAGACAVAHKGQSLRQVLIEDMKDYIGGLTAAVDGNMNPPQNQAAVVDALSFYYEFDAATSGQNEHGVSTDPAPLQTVYDDIGGANLKDKLAGNDASTDHKDWDDGTSFAGWTDPTIAQHGGSTTSPEGLLIAMFNTLGWYVEDRIVNGPQNEPGTNTPLSQVYLTTTGVDLQQLIQKFLLMAITYSQATDDYLDNATPDKGLLVVNTQDGDQPYTSLGHQWDEGFGYFGAAGDYPLFSDEEIAKAGGRDDWQGYHDTNGDGAIDLTKEFVWGAAQNCAKRDLGSDPAAPTDFTADAFSAFLAGRALIHAASDPLTSNEMTELEGHANAATDAWEKAIAATVVHYINDVIADTEVIDSAPASYNYANHAKHFSEMKGFALGLQFNPRSKVSDTDFALLHGLLGDAPVLATATIAQRAAYVTALLAARDILQTSYSFANENAEGW